MARRKGELSPRMIDLGWPHQVALPAEALFGGGYYTTHFYCEDLSLCPRKRHFHRDRRDYVVFCFADATHAELFRERFDGELVVPQTEQRRVRR